MTKREREKESKRRTEREMRQTERRGETIRREITTERGQRRAGTRIEINRKGKTRATNKNQTYNGASIETG